jgi:hypothetical protein
MESGRFKLLLASVPLSLFAVGCAAPNPMADGANHAATSTPAPVPSGSHDGRAAFALREATIVEKQYGVQIAHVGLTAGGGLVDVRFKVLDAAKAQALLGNAANVPMLMAGDKPPVMPPHHALRGARFGEGRVFYILYPNSRGAIQPGVEVTVAVGDARLGPVVAQ